MIQVDVLGSNPLKVKVCALYAAIYRFDERGILSIPQYFEYEPRSNVKQAARNRIVVSWQTY